MTEPAHKPQSPCPTTQTPPPRYPGFTPRVPRPKNGLGTAALAIAVVAWAVDLTVFPLGKAWPIFGGAIVGVVAVVVGGAALRRARRGEAGGSRFAIAGIVLGFAALMAGIALGVLAMIGFALFTWLYALMEGN
ncbi:hypothetical protein [Mycobacterium paragordonae]|uniref:hypothetical protein n=1 Tax=Mycobacterium paragordonae TaxID=1389713 RepID=UPI00105FB1F8|nr:hypothetical protein [Mycobacterium paragordonae]TDL04336.1 hypothetical protein EUA05_21560 [Mycobacterium paragordonae]